MAVVVEIADQGRFTPRIQQSLFDLGHGRCCLGQINRDSHHLRSGFGELPTLLSRGLDVGGVGVGHGLDHDRRTPSDLDLANMNTDCVATHIYGPPSRATKTGEIIASGLYNSCGRTPCADPSCD